MNAQNVNSLQVRVNSTTFQNLKTSEGSGAVFNVENALASDIALDSSNFYNISSEINGGVLSSSSLGT